MIKKIINEQAKSIMSAAMVISGLSLASRFLGLVRDRILAEQFGTGEQIEMYLVAFRLPDFFYNLIILGALSAGFIPIFTGYLDFKKRDKTAVNSEAWIFVNNILNILLAAMISSAIIFALGAPKIMPFLAPGFNADQLETTALLTRIMFLSPIFLAISGIFGGILQSFRLFFVYALSPIAYNVGIIIGAAVFTRFWGVYGLAYGVVLGAILHLAIQLPLVWRLGYRYRGMFDWRSRQILLLAKMMVPRVMSLAVSQANILATTIIASTLAGGSIAIMYYAQNLQGVVIGTIGISFALAAFPTLADLANRKETEKLRRSFSRTARQILFFAIPVSVFMIVLRAQLVRVIYGAEKFTWNDTILTLEAVEFFALSLFAQCLIPLINRVFWAKNNTRTPFLVALASVILNIVLALALSERMGVTGLAAAFSISMIFNFLLLAHCLKKEIGGIDEKIIFVFAVKILFASAFAGYICRWSLYLAAPLVDMRTFFGILIQGFIAGTVGLITLALVCWALKLEELISFKDSLARRLFKTKIIVSEIENEK